jgi:putative chitinase
MQNRLTAEQLRLSVGCTLANATVFVEPINITIERFGINTPEKISMFLAQIGHESASLSAVSENLNYSTAGLRATFPKYFPTEDIAASYARNPMKIANRVYANRLGNGPETSGDGWRFRGRGLIQITGRDNYARISKDLDIDCLNHPEILESPLYAALSAGQFWEWRSLNNTSDVQTVTRKINGGLNGLYDRVARYQKALRFFA